MVKLTSSQIKKLAELALIRAMPDQELDSEWRETQKLKPLLPGRLRGLFIRLTKAVDMELQTMPQPSIVEIDKVNDLIRKFGVASGWEYRAHSIVTNIPFCLGLLETSESKINPKILGLMHDIKAMNNIMHFFEHKTPVRIRPFSVGAFAAEKWEGLFS